MATLTAVVQGTDPPKVQITAEGITGDTMTLYRAVAGNRFPVRGALNAPPTGTAMVWVDHGAPFGVPVQYVLVEQDAATETETETVSNQVTLLSSAPWITNPITGEGVEITIETWPELTYAARQTLVDVSGRPAPIVVSDVRSAAASGMTLLTRTREQLYALRDVLASGDVLQVRPVCGAVETEYIAVGTVTESRYREKSGLHATLPAGSDWRRRVALDVQIVEQPFPQIPAVGDTLADLAAYVPTTLADLAEAFGPDATLLTIAATDLSDA